MDFFRKHIDYPNKLTINILTMKKSNLFYRLMPILILLMTVAISALGAGPTKQQYYEIKIYHITDKTQEGKVDIYLKEAYLPALHRAGIPIVGVFKPVEADTAFGKIIYVFIPFKTVDQFMQLAEQLQKDKVFSEAGKPFADAVAVKGDCSCAATCGTLGIYCRKMVATSKKDSKRTTAFFITKPTLYYFFSLLTFLAGWADEIWRF